LRWLYWADCTDSWCSPNASSPLYIASYIYANVWCLDLCLCFAALRAFCALSQVSHEQFYILYAAEIVIGKEKPEQFDAQYEREEGKTSSLLARLTRSIWHSGKVVILDSGFCVLQALIINFKKKRGLYAGAVIKKRKYWPKFIQGMCYSYITVLIDMILILTMFVCIYIYIYVLLVSIYVDLTDDDILSVVHTLFVIHILIQGNMIDHRFCEGYEVGDTYVLHGVIDDTQYDIFCMKEEDYVIKIMATYGSNCPPIGEVPLEPAFFKHAAEVRDTSR
jgi:hypothetical protein